MNGVLNVVCLPATDPSDMTYGTIPGCVGNCPEAVVHRIHYPSLVWYNQDVQIEAIRQIDAMDVDHVVLVGFSKSGLGAWNVARAIPARTCATIIFDAPMARQSLPPWGTAPFYDGDESWRRDLPINSIHHFQSAMSRDHRLVLISGEGFSDDMRRTSLELASIGLKHLFLDRPKLKHHWNSGWLEEGLDALRAWK